MRHVLWILPAYYTLLALLLVLRTSSVAFAGLSFIYLANLTSFFGVTCDYGPLWGLAVEEHFYILWPAVVRKLTMQRLVWVSAAIVVFVPALRAISFTLRWKDGLDWYTWLVADGLATGALLAIGLRTPIRRRQLKRPCAALLASALLVAFVGMSFGADTRNRLLGASLQLTIINIFFAGVLLLFLLAGSGTRARAVNIAPLRFLGYISYGLYLDHLLVFRMYDRIFRHYWPGLLPSNGHFELVLFRFLVGGSVAIGIAYLSRRFFEERFLRLKNSLVPDHLAGSAAETVAANTQAA